MKIVYALVLSIALTGCAGLKQKDPAVAVYEIQSNYNAGLTIAVAYKSLPRCELPKAPKLCAKASVVKQIRDADDVAYPALKAAQASVRSGKTGMEKVIDAANTAVNALIKIVQYLEVK